MIKTIKTFSAFIKLAVKINSAYITAVWASIAINTIQIIIFYYIWMSVYRSDTVINGISKQNIITYIILARILWMQIDFGINLQISSMINTGGIAIELVRPVDFQFMMYSLRFGDFISFLIISGTPVLMISILIFNFTLPPSFHHLALFSISLIFGITIIFFIEYCVGLISFYTQNGWGIHTMKVAVISFLTGAVIPLDFFPGILKTIIFYLPFKDIIYVPISIYLGIRPLPQLYSALSVQLLWCIILLIFSRIIFRISVKRNSVHGG
ncbi:ABC-2 family transporter protein [Candidatus Dependentiae bacterium]|nr:ABC-2 family transporter protein [Candidatus Dependentiae bacterium]